VGVLVLRLLEKFGAQGAFNPEEVSVLVDAFDAAWYEVQRSGVRFGSDKQRELARNTFGKYIIEQAKTGERDRRRLREGALLYYAKTARRR
jgi:hypothetical protein